MKRTPLSVLGLGLSCLLVGTVAVPGTAAAEETTCRGRIGSRTVDNVRVPQGASCTLEGTRVEGTITVKGDAVLRAREVRVIGNVQAENHDHVSVVRSRVGGSVQLEQGGTASIRRNKVNQDVQLFTNRGEQRVVHNTIDGNLQCKENRPAPTGGDNEVGGNKEDQCRRL